MKNKKIKVLQLIHSLHIGGAEDVVANLAMNIDKNVFDIEVCCIKELGVLAEKLGANDIRVHLLGVGNNGKYIESYKKLKQLIDDVKPDILHSHCDPALINLGPYYMLNRKGVASIHTYHFGNYPHIAKKYLYAQRLFARYVNQLVAVSDSQRESIIQHHKVKPSNIITIRNGVKENQYLADQVTRQNIRKEFGILDDQILVGCVAVLSKQKGVTYLLAAAKELKNQNDNLRILIVGGGPLHQELENKSREYGLDGYVIFTGWRKDALKIISALDIFVQPSLWEAFSVVLLEAMAAKLPIIATNVADNAKVIENGESGLVVNPKEPDALKQAILELAGNQQKAFAMAANAHAKFTENYTVSHMVANHEELYKRMASNN